MLDLKPRNIEIYDIELIDIDKKEETFKIIAHVSKGTYIRVLSEDIAKALGELRNNAKFKKAKSTADLA